MQIQLPELDGDDAKLLLGERDLQIRQLQKQVELMARQLQELGPGSMTAKAAAGPTPIGTGGKKDAPKTT